MSSKTDECAALYKEYIDLCTEYSESIYWRGDSARKLPLVVEYVRNKYLKQCEMTTTIKIYKTNEYFFNDKLY